MFPAPPSDGGPPSGTATVGPALRRYWYIPVALFVVALAASIFVSSQRDPVYTASARLAVGTTNVNTPQALGGFAASAPALAATYSRGVTADRVVDAVAKRLKLDAVAVRENLVASPVPETPVIRIDATGSSEELAVELANASSEELADYAGDLNTSTANGEELLRRYRDAQREVAAAQAARDRARGRAESGGSGDRAALRRARAELLAAVLRARTIENAYQTSQEALGASNPVQILEQASSAKSDRRATFQRNGFVFGVMALVLGAALAVLLYNRSLRRR